MKPELKNILVKFYCNNECHFKNDFDLIDIVMPDILNCVTFYEFYFVTFSVRHRNWVL